MKAHGFKLCCCFLLPISMCIDVNFILAYVMIGNYVLRVSTHYTFATNTVTKEMLVINEPAHVAVRLQLFEMSSITTLDQTVWNVCTRYIFQRVLLKEKYLQF